MSGRRSDQEQVGRTRRRSRRNPAVAIPPRSASGTVSPRSPTLDHRRRRDRGRVPPDWHSTSLGRSAATPLTHRRCGRSRRARKFFCRPRSFATICTAVAPNAVRSLRMHAATTADFTGRLVPQTADHRCHHQRKHQLMPEFPQHVQVRLGRLHRHQHSSRNKRVP